ncbi:MAG TPA: PDZ domain-containing protein [Planctomycetota bacterium]|nr:PDZ domain-containing protein [Planctomycetota bacterium]
MLALLVLSLLQTPEQRFDPETTKLLVFDASRGMTLRIQTDGKVELTVKEEDKETGTKGSRTLSEASAEEFRAKHPELVKKYELDRYLGGKTKGVSQDEFDEWWKQLRKGMPGLGPVPGLDQPFDEDVQKFLEEQRELFGRLRRSPKPQTPDSPPHQTPVPGGRELGVRVDPVSETLRDQLSLKENEGVLVSEVKPGSLAEKSGLKEHDLLLKLEGRPIGDRWQFRADVLTALGKPEFAVELLRAGKKQTLTIKTSARKDE